MHLVAAIFIFAVNFIAIYNLTHVIASEIMNLTSLTSDHLLLISFAGSFLLTTLYLTLSSDPYKPQNLIPKIKQKTCCQIPQTSLNKNALIMALQRTQKLELEYERFAWETGKIFLPLSFALIGYSLSFNDIKTSVGIILASSIVYALYLVFFLRFRHNIRTYRTLTILIEQELSKFGGIPIVWIAEQTIPQQKIPRIWTALLTLGFLLYPLLILLAIKKEGKIMLPYF